MWSEEELEHENLESVSENLRAPLPKRTVLYDPLRWLLVGSVMVLAGLVAATVSLVGFGWWQMRSVSREEFESSLPLQLREDLAQTSLALRGAYFMWVRDLGRWFGMPRVALHAQQLAKGLLIQAGAPVDPIEMKSVEAELLAKAGDLGAAEAAHREVLAATEDGGGQLWRAYALSELGGLLLATGRYGEGLSTLEQALPALRAADQEFLASVVSLALGAAYGGPIGQRSVLRTALEASAAPPWRGAGGKWGKLESTLGSSLLLLGETGEVFDDRKARRGLKALLLRLGDRQVSSGHSNTPRGKLDICGAPNSQDGKSGPKFVHWQVNPVSFFRYVVPLVLASAEIRVGRWDLASSGLERLLASDGLIEIPFPRGVALLPAGLALWHTGDAQGAIDRLRESIACFELDARHLGSWELSQSYEGNRPSMVYPVLLEMLVLEKEHETAFDYSERARSRSLLLGLDLEGRPSAEVEEVTSLETEADRILARLRSLERDLAQASPSGRQEAQTLLDSLRAQYSVLATRREVANRNYQGVSSPPTSKRSEVQSSVPQGTTLISFFSTPARTHAWVIDHNTFEWFSLPPFDGDITAPLCFSDAVRRTARGMDPLDGRGSAADTSAEDLYRQLIVPLREKIHGTKLILIPHGPLHYVPFAALRNPETGRYLVEDFTLTLAPSASVLRFLREKESPLRGRALVLGAPQAADPRLSSLEGSGIEAEAVAKMLRAKPLLGPDAAEAALSEIGGEVDILHLAAHGVYYPQSPRFSRIALSPGGGEDGNLEVHEILAELDLSSVNLVVLSACETALGQRSGGDEIVGLTRAFLYAGAPGVISTLWSVDDEASAELMTNFYRRWKGGESVAEALRSAQLAMLRQERYSDPYFWAGYTLIGDPLGRWPRFP